MKFYFPIIIIVLFSTISYSHILEEGDTVVWAESKEINTSDHQSNNIEYNSIIETVVTLDKDKTVYSGRFGIFKSDELKHVVQTTVGVNDGVTFERDWIYFDSLISTSIDSSDNEYDTTWNIDDHVISSKWGLTKTRDFRITKFDNIKKEYVKHYIQLAIKKKEGNIYPEFPINVSAVLDNNSQISSTPHLKTDLEWTIDIPNNIHPSTYEYTLKIDTIQSLKSPIIITNACTRTQMSNSLYPKDLPNEFLTKDLFWTVDLKNRITDEITPSKDTFKIRYTVPQGITITNPINNDSLFNVFPEISFIPDAYKVTRIELQNSKKKTVYLDTNEYKGHKLEMVSSFKINIVKPYTLHPFETYKLLIMYQLDSTNKDTLISLTEFPIYKRSSEILKENLKKCNNHEIKKYEYLVMGEGAGRSRADTLSVNNGIIDLSWHFHSWGYQSSHRNYGHVHHNTFQNTISVLDTVHSIYSDSDNENDKEIKEIYYTFYPGIYNESDSAYKALLRVCLSECVNALNNEFDSTSISFRNYLEEYYTSIIEVEEISIINTHQQHFSQKYNLLNRGREIYITPKENLHVSLFNAKGQQLVTKNLEQTKKQTCIKLTSLSSSIYFLNIRTKNNSFIHKLHLK